MQSWDSCINAYVQGQEGRLNLASTTERKHIGSPQQTSCMNCSLLDSQSLYSDWIVIVCEWIDDTEFPFLTGTLFIIENWSYVFREHCHQGHHTDFSCPKSIIYNNNYSPSQIPTFLYIPLKLTRKHSSTLLKIIHLSTQAPAFTRINTGALLPIWCCASFPGGGDAANDRISKRWRTAPGALNVPVNTFQISKKAEKL